MECNLQLTCSVLRDDTQSPDFNLNIKLENVDTGEIESITAKENKSITLYKTDDSNFLARSEIHLAG